MANVCRKAESCCNHWESIPLQLHNSDHTIFNPNVMLAVSAVRMAAVKDVNTIIVLS